MSIKLIAFYLVVFLSNVIQSITGFAGTVLAMPFSVMLVGYSTAKPILNILGILVSIGVVSINIKALNKKELARIVGIMLVGMVIGTIIVGKATLNESLLYRLLGVIVLLFMGIGCYHTFVKSKREQPATAKDSSSVLHTIVDYAILVLAGIVHGMFVCGGPLLIIYASDRIKNRDEFRVTLSMVWVILNSVNLVSDIRLGNINRAMLLPLGVSVVILFGALLLGSYLARRLNNKWFMIITYALMGISGVSLFIK